MYKRQKNNKPHIFTTPRPLGSGVVKIWGLLFFFKYKIGNNDFTTILGSVNVKNMTPTTIFLQIRRKMSSGEYGSFRVSVDTKHHTHGTYLKWRPHFGFQKQIVHNPGCFCWWIPTRSSELRIRIHRIVTYRLYIYEIHHVFDEVHSSCVTFVPYDQLNV